MAQERTSYLDIVKHYEQCFEKYGDNYKGVDWPELEDVKKRYQVMIELMSRYSGGGYSKPSGFWMWLRSFV